MPRVQYSLGSLFELTLGGAAFSACLAVWLHRGSPVDPRLVWIIAWLILTTIYRKQHARGVMKVNALAAITLGPCLVLAWPAWSSWGGFGLPVPEDALTTFATAASFACLAGTVVSFPAFVVWFLLLRRPADRAGDGARAE
jgi:hypothetical protein